MLSLSNLLCKLSCNQMSVRLDSMFLVWIASVERELAACDFQVFKPYHSLQKCWFAAVVQSSFVFWVSLVTWRPIWDLRRTASGHRTEWSGVMTALCRSLARFLFRISLALPYTPTGVNLLGHNTTKIKTKVRKAKVALEQSMKAHRGSRCVALLFL